MTGAVSATTLVAFAVGTAAVGTAYSIYQGERAAGQQKEALKKQAGAQEEARMAARSQARQSDEAMGRANRKTPDTGGIMAAASQAAQGGPGSTMLTGPTGVDPNALSLGKNTLLGG